MHPSTHNSVFTRASGCLIIILDHSIIPADSCSETINTEVFVERIVGLLQMYGKSYKID